MSPSVSDKHLSSSTLEPQGKTSQSTLFLWPIKFLAKKALPLLLRWSSFLPKLDSFIFLLSIKPILFCKQKFFRWALVSGKLLSNFCLSFVTITDENARLGDGTSLETCFTIFFAFFNNLILLVKSPVHTCYIRSSQFLLTINQGLLQFHCLFHQESFQLWGLLTPFSDMPFNIEYPVTTTSFLFLSFDGLFLSSLPKSVLPFFILVLLLVLMILRQTFLVFESEVSKFLSLPSKAYL